MLTRAREKIKGAPGVQRGLALTAGLLLATSMSTAKACSRDPSKPPPSQADLFADASIIFVAHLIRTDEVTASTLTVKRTS